MNPQVPASPLLPEGAGKTWLLNADRTLVMGVLNVTPDSFSDGGRWQDPQAAVERAYYLRETGADLIDVGGESTRPGSTRIDATAELQRVLQVVETLVAAGFTVSVDTVHAETARRCVDAGAAVINDISGGCFDREMLSVMAATDALCVIQHWRGFPGTDSERLLTQQVVPTVVAELGGQIERALAAGVDSQRIIIDPGFGFAKDVSSSWELFRQLPVLQAALPYPLLVGTSRKRMLKFLSDQLHSAEPAAEVGVDELTAATTVLAAQAGAWAVRVHEPAASRAGVEVVKYLHSK